MSVVTQASRFWITQGEQMALYIDPSNSTGNASDTHVGDDPTKPIATCAELTARTQNLNVSKANLDIYFLSSNSNADPLRIDRLGIYSPNPLTTQRRVTLHLPSPTSYGSGTFSAVQVLDRGLNQAYIVTDAAQSWTNPKPDPLGGARGKDFQRVRISGGPRDGARAWTAQANNPLVGGAMRTSNWNIPDPVALATTPIIPASGDAYVLEYLPTLYIDRIHVVGNGDSFGSGFYMQGADAYLVHGFDSQEVGNEMQIIQDGACIVLTDCLFECDLQPQSRAAGSFIYTQNCASIDALLFIRGGMLSNFVDAGLYHLALGAAGTGAGVYLSADPMVETGAVLASGGATVLAGTVGVFEGNGHTQHGGVICDDGDVRMSVDFYGNQGIYGTGTAVVGGDYPVGVALANDGHLLHNDTDLGTLTIKGSDPDHDFSIDNSLTARTFDSVVGQATPMHDCTYANLVDPSIATGFNKLAILPDKGSTAGIRKVEPIAG